MLLITAPCCMALMSAAAQTLMPAGCRPTCSEILQHPWLQQEGHGSDRPLDNVVLTRMRKFAGVNKLKKTALMVIGTCLTPEEIAGMKRLFKTIDHDRNGKITVSELKVRRAACRVLRAMCCVPCATHRVVCAESRVDVQLGRHGRCLCCGCVLRAACCALYLARPRGEQCSLRPGGGRRRAGGRALRDTG